MAGQILLLNWLGFMLLPPQRKQLFPDLICRPLKGIIIGLSSAFILFLIFFLGRAILTLIWPVVGQQIERVYGFKQGYPSYYLGFLLGIIIGPGEEILWRWLLQGEWMKKLGSWPGLALVSGIYALVHLPTRNPILVLAALTCGLFWGCLFLKFRSALVNIISHGIWDVIIFVILPLR
ncbi:MAG: lysostaphin resistance A-like protein [Candidatus Aminicenantales bacterium]